MHSIPQKRCSKCGVEKPLSEFHKNKRTCKACRKVESKTYYWQDPELQRAKLRQRRESKPGYGTIALRQPYFCSRCGQTKTADDFYVDRRRRFGHYPYCKNCRKAIDSRDDEKIKAYHRRHYEQNRDSYGNRANKWVKNNPDKRRAIVRIHAHKRRAWKRGSDGSFTQQEWLLVCEYCHNECLCCGKREPDITLTPDHIVPLSRGGSNTIDNIQPLCLTCNISKNARTVDYRGKGNCDTT
jgi:5-methylcytosine-specific restriction endonuclease McrA